MKKHFHQFYYDSLLQEISLMKVSEESEFLKELSTVREVNVAKFFKTTEEYFQNTDVDFKSIEALLIGGIDYIVLHSKFNESKFYSIDINNLDHQAKNCISNTLKKATLIQNQFFQKQDFSLEY